MADPLVLLHGFTGAPASFRAVESKLSTALSTCTIALPGHDGTPPPRDLEHALSVVAQKTAVIRRPFRLAGYSLGGRLAMHYALRYPQHISALVVFGARPGITDLEQRAIRLAHDRKMVELLRRDGLEAFLTRWEAQPLLTPRTTNDAAIAESKAIRRGHDPMGLAQALQELSVAALPDLWPKLETFSCPVTWVSGDADTAYGALMTKAAARVGRHVAIPGSGHAVLVDAPDAVAEILAAPCRANRSS